jgi:hypothetical protein
MVLLASVVAAALVQDPYTIFARAREYWLEQRYPVSVRYDVAVGIEEGGKARIERYASSYDSLDNAVSVDPVSDYERDHPVYPHGVNIGVLGFALSKPQPTDDFLGVPHLSPEYSFGMVPFIAPGEAGNPFDSPLLVAQIRHEFHDPNPHPTAEPSGAPREIAVVDANDRAYRIALLGTGDVDGHACFHLGLTPTRDPGKFRIREAWIDEANFATWELKDASNFTSGPETAVPWTIHFVDVDGAHYVGEEDALAPISTQGLIYTSARIAFENIVPAALRAQPYAPPQNSMLVEP